MRVSRLIDKFLTGAAVIIGLAVVVALIVAGGFR